MQLTTDSSGTNWTISEIALRTTLLAEKIQNHFEGKYIGLLLPTSVVGVVGTLAVLSCKKVPVFINYTASTNAIQYALEKCAIDSLLTVKGFPERLGLQIETDFILIENLMVASEIADELSTPEIKNKGFEPPSTIFPNLHDTPSPSDTATVIFSSGSTGTPKGVVLSHKNLNSNCNSIMQVLKIKEEDVLFGALPFFHSFGFLATLWLPLYQRIKTVYHTNPMDAQAIGELISKHKCTILFGTPTFLQSYIRKCTPEQMKSLRLVITGAERLPPELAQRFYEKFGVLPVEGYGCTELSPVVSINIPEFQDKIGSHCGKPRSVGKPLPGINVKIINPENHCPLAENEEGLLLVKGPNVMQGYLGELEKTEAVLKNGWYNTGDMAKIDRSGYLYITGRYSRFSKIGGEMVPHIGLEEEIHSILETTEIKVVVTAVSDALKGEKLIVLHLKIAKNPREIVSELRKKGIANLWIPKVKDFYEIDRIPYLGSGKLDLAGIRDLAGKLSI